MGHIPHGKYHISDDGKIYRINDDGSFTVMGNVEDSFNGEKNASSSSCTASPKSTVYNHFEKDRKPSLKSKAPYLIVGFTLMIISLIILFKQNSAPDYSYEQPGHDEYGPVNAPANDEYADAPANEYCDIEYDSYGNPI